MAVSAEGTFLDWLNNSMKSGLTESIVPDREQLKRELESEKDPEILARVS
jgi:hypothetical protein